MNLPSHRPFDPARAPFFYGWVILVVGTLGILVSAPAQTMGVSAFTDFLISDLPISRTNLSMTYLLGTLGSSFILTRAGRIYDRHGARLVGSITIVLKWFVRRRGLTNGFVGIATSVGFSSAVIAFNGAIDYAGWQTTWRILGVILAVPVALLFLLTARDNPQECGLKPDGPGKALRRNSSLEMRPTVDFTVVQAQRTLTFWVFLGTVTLASMYFTGLTFNIVSIFEEAGYPRSLAIAIFLLASGAAIFLSAPLMVVLLILGKGINGGMFGLVASVTWPRYYGLLHLGAITGFVMGWGVAGSALGPYLFSLALNGTGSYAVVSVVVALVAGVLLLLSPFANRPKAPRP
jgi:MFS transporter, OFA family, oxalate/formate antiporter